MYMKTKDQYDNLPDTKDDICAGLHAILHRIARILQQSSAYLSLFERWRTNRSLQNVNSSSGRSFRAFRDLPDNTVLRVE